LPHSDLNIFLDELAALDPATPAQDIWAATTGYFARNGFDKLIYMHQARADFTLMTTLPTAWLNRYHTENYYEIDPFYHYCGSTFQPISTGAAYADQHRELTAAQRNLIAEAAEFGINAGFSSTEEIMRDQHYAGWNIGSSLTRAEVDELRQAKELELRLAAHHAHLKLKRANLQKRVLSMREWECLSLLAQGLRNKEIARALNISPAAVELYLKNARLKLGASTREHSVALATARGLLGDVPRADH
jgi:DNA-binding CsgD family transcriptional regulator